MKIRLFQTILILLFLTHDCFCQTYKGIGESTSGIYKCVLKINPDSTILFNYFDNRGNSAFADFKGNIKKIKDSIYQIKCEMVFGQFFMKNFYPNNLTIVVDSGAQTLFTLKKIKVKYKDGTDTLFNIKYLKKSIFQNAFGTATHKIYKNQDDSDILVDIGYKDIIFHKKVIFEISSPSALNFVSSTTQIFTIKITGDNIITVGTPILQTGHLTMKKI